MLLGYNEKDLASLNAAIFSGNITDDAELIVSDPERIYDVYHWKPQIGDTVTFNFKNHSGETITKAFKIGAITSSNDGMGGYIFRMPENMLKELNSSQRAFILQSTSAFLLPFSRIMPNGLSQ